VSWDPKNPDTWPLFGHLCRTCGELDLDPEAQKVHRGCGGSLAWLPADPLSWRVGQLSLNCPRCSAPVNVAHWRAVRGCPYCPWPDRTLADRPFRLGTV